MALVRTRRLTTAMPVGMAVAIALAYLPSAMVFAATGQTTVKADDGRYSRAVQAMKTADRGPFSQLRWFCKDGTVLPPKAYACGPHGGGYQHGDYSGQATELRNAGYWIANVLIELKPEVALANDAERLKWALVERFLIDGDDGWIFRKARFYRGGVQAEDEAEGAKTILAAMVRDQRYATTHFLLLREAARLLPWQENSPAQARQRGLAVTVADNNPAFASLRNKLHGSPAPADIDAVRAFAQGVSKPTTQRQLNELIAALEEVFAPVDLSTSLRVGAAKVSDSPLAKNLNALAADWRDANSNEQKLTVAANALATLRDGLAAAKPDQRLALLNMSLQAEQAAFAAGRRLLPVADSASRQWRLGRLGDNINALYGLGLLTARERRALNEELSSLPENPTVSEYRESLDYLARAPGWADARMNFYFGPTLNKLANIESRAHGLVPDRLRGSPMLLHGDLLDALVADGDRLAGIRHELFGKPVSVGLKSLNPGLARGPIRALESLAPGAVAQPPIVLAPETAADLPAVAGILTSRAGNSLSHVQLLARNLGIPNVVVSADLLPAIQSRLGKTVVLLASAGGVVRLVEDGPQWDPVFGKKGEAVKPTAIQLDLDKLDLTRRDFIDLATLRASDSGRTVGPKAAKLGELKALFPQQVSAGLALPFGLFRQMLDKPHTVSGPSTFEWMKQNYARLDGIKDEAERERQTSQFLALLRNWITAVKFDDSFKQQLNQRMNEVFGKGSDYGVFVRSDTNVEDLAGFTGAGLNLTLPNVSGLDNVLDAIKQVWASPFTERAFGWRQALMNEPEHVYAAVLLHKSVPGDFSGVMITADLADDSRDALSIAVNEGVSGGVDGQAAEALRVNVATGKVRLLQSAAEPTKKVLPRTGGAKEQAASGADSLLGDNEIRQLIEFAESIPTRYPKLLDAQGNAAPADVEFAFADGKLSLIQIRPFLQSTKARRSQVLAELDAGLKNTANNRLALSAAPTGTN